MSTPTTTESASWSLLVLPIIVCVAMMVYAMVAWPPSVDSGPVERAGTCPAAGAQPSFCSP